MVNTVRNVAASQVTPLLYLNEKYADVHFTLLDDDDNIEKVPANKIILAALSPVFDAMFFGNLKEGKEVEIVDASAAAFEEFLQFFYLNEIKLTIENIECVARLADKYDIVKHFRACAGCLKSQLNPSNMCWGYEMALAFDDKELIEFCKNKILESPREAFASDAFKQCKLQTLEHMLRLDLTCNELDIFKACLSWAKRTCQRNNLNENQATNLKNQLGDCLKLIRFGDMAIEDLMEIISTNKDLFTMNEFQEICSLMSTKGYKPNIFNQQPRNYSWNANADAIVECKRSLESSGTGRKSFNWPQVVVFTSNQPVLLGKLWTQPLLDVLEDHSRSTLPTQTNRLSSHTQSNLTLHQIHPMLRFHSSLSRNVPPAMERARVGGAVKVTITEIGGNRFDTTNARVLFESSNCCNWIGEQLQANLPKPILIKPNIVYKLHLNSLHPHGNSTFGEYNSPFKTMQEFRDGLKIGFHPNDDHSSNDWFETFVFNKL